LQINYLAVEKISKSAFSSANPRSRANSGRFALIERALRRDKGQNIVAVVGGEGGFMVDRDQS
jgi:hypothetical protein